MAGNFDALKLNVALGGRSYDIFVGGGLTGGVGERVRGIMGAARGICVISDENVWQAHGPELAASLDAAGIGYDFILVPPGEGSKSMPRLSVLYDWFGEGGRLTRDGIVIAFGGGVVGDLAGFAAATWMRGVRYVQIPTTLLAMVDSSVGGKTAIDTGRGKNLVGAFHQPVMVIADTDLLGTLPEREYGAGFAEVIKYGAIASAELFEALKIVPDFADGGASGFPDIIRSCCAIKSAIVSEDEFDRGKRALLNFGHTFGHALEAKYGFEKYNHGEAVAAGMSIAAALGEEIGVTVRGTAERLNSLLEKYGLRFCESAEELIPYMKSDKKAGGESVNLVLLKNIGEAFSYEITWGELAEMI
jgi:3-dehydroquinate synthase